MSIAKTVWQLLNYQFLLYKAKRGGMPPPLLGRSGKNFVLAFRSIVQTGPKFQKFGVFLKWFGNY